MRCAPHNPNTDHSCMPNVHINRYTRGVLSDIDKTLHEGVVFLLPGAKGWNRKVVCVNRTLSSPALGSASCTDLRRELQGSSRSATCTPVSAPLRDRHNNIDSRINGRKHTTYTVRQQSISNFIHHSPLKRSSTGGSPLQCLSLLVCAARSFHS